MTTNPSQNTDPPGQTPPGSDPQGQTPNPQSQTQSGTSQKTPIDSLPADIQDYIARLRSEAEEANKQKKAEAHAKQAALEARLREQGEFKQLAEKHEARVKELEPIQESYTRLAEQINAQIAAETKDWPTEVKSLVPDINVPVESRLEQVAKLRPLIAQLTQQARGQAPGNRPNPPAQGQPSREDMIAANMRELKKQRTYGI